jgi:hypothetical protein
LEARGEPAGRRMTACLKRKRPPNPWFTSCASFSAVSARLSGGAYSFVATAEALVSLTGCFLVIQNVPGHRAIRWDEIDRTSQ